jgi:hypothetical protein
MLILQDFVLPGQVFFKDFIRRFEDIIGAFSMKLFNVSNKMADRLPLGPVLMGTAFLHFNQLV